LDVILTAGGIPSQKDPLHTAARGGYKAMIDINGKPMIQWVLNALSGATKIERIILVGLPPVTDLNSAKPIAIVEEQGDLLSNIRAGCHEVSSQHTGDEHVLLVAADIPLLEPYMVDWMVDQVSTSEADVNYGLVDKALMESTFPGARKNFITLKEQQICGGEMNAIRLKIAGSGDPVWQRLVEARKTRSNWHRLPVTTPCSCCNYGNAPSAKWKRVCNLTLVLPAGHCSAHTRKLLLTWINHTSWSWSKQRFANGMRLDHDTHNPDLGRQRITTTAAA